MLKIQKIPNLLLLVDRDDQLAYFTMFTLVKVWKKRWAPTTIFGVIFGRKRMWSFKSSWWRIQICAGYLEKCSMFRTTIIAFRLGGHTLIWTEPKWHVKVDSFVLNTTNVLVELLTTMIDINKWDSILTTCFSFHTCQIISCWWLTISFLVGSLR
jgi:hypothetical protein